MYFYVYNGRLYWGRYQNITPHRNVYTWIFRNKPVRIKRIYITGQESFFAIASSESQFGCDVYTLMISSPGNFGDGSFRSVTIKEGYCYHLNNGGWSMAASTGKNETNRQQFKRTFKNRLREYKGRYFLPIEKHSNYA